MPPNGNGGGGGGVGEGGVDLRTARVVPLFEAGVQQSRHLLYLLQRLSVAIQWGNAASVFRTIKLDSEDYV